MDHVINRLLLILLSLWGTAEAATYYEKTTVPPTIAVYTILCNNTAAVAAPIQCKFSDGSTNGNLALVIGSYSPVSASGATVNKYNTVFGVAALNSVTNIAGSAGNTAFGYQALLSGTTVSGETAVGKLALRDDVEGNFNTGIGQAALRCFTGTGTKTGNTAVGHGAMAGDDTLCATIVGGSPNTGGGNTAIGAWSMQEITTGVANTAVGDSAGLNLTTGLDNVSIGFYAGPCADTTVDTSGEACSGASNSVAVGYHALRMDQSTAMTGVGFNALAANTTGTLNTALGYQALSVATVGVGSTAVGYDALQNESGVGLNTALGANAGKALTSGTQNSYIGANSGLTNQTANNDTAIGQAALTLATGGANTALGSHAGASVTNGNTNVFIGNQVASTTCTSCAGNILIGLDATTDTAASGTTHTLQIRGVSPGVATLACTAINTASPACTFPGTLAVTGGMALSSLSTQATNTVAGNATSGTAVPTALAVGTCSTASSALIWTTNTGFGCNTAINATTATGVVSGAAAAAGVVGQVASIDCPVNTAAAASTSVTVTIATPGVVTWTSHTFTPSSGLANYTCPINFLGTPPTGIAVGTNYYIIGSSVSGDTFQISDTAAHALAGTNAVATTGSDGGTTARIGNLATTATVYNGAALQLVAGDWDCSGVGEFQELTALTMQRYATGLATVGGAFGAIGTFFDDHVVSGAVGAFNNYFQTPVLQENISATTSVILITSANFTVGTMGQAGLVRCRRMR